MKKFFAIAVFAVLVVPYGVYASSISGVTTQGKDNFGVSLELDWSFERDLELDKIDLGLAVKDIQAKEHYTIPVKLSYGITDNVDIYGQVGYSDFSNEGNLPALGDFDADSDGSASYAIGAKGTFMATNGLLYGADAQYSWGKNDNKISVANGAVTDNGEVKNMQWHIAPYIGKQFEQSVAYIGVRYSDAKYEHEFDALGSIDFEAKDNVGVFFGFDYETDETSAVNIEVRLVDETAVTIGATKKF
jgi:hypothetical protein